MLDFDALPKELRLVALAWDVYVKSVQREFTKLNVEQKRADVALFNLMEVSRREDTD